MRAKEYLAYRRNDIYYYDSVSNAIQELYPLRFDRSETEEYFNRYLFADARSRAENNFVLREGEVDPSIAVAVRIEMRHVIAEDESFIYAYNIIAEGRNKFSRYETMKLCELKEENINTIHEIKEVYRQYREDYPKNVLSDFLLDPHNRDFHNSRNKELRRDKEWWLEAFNRAYALFDEIRTQLHRPYEARFLVMNLALDDEDLRRNVVDIVCCLLEHYDFRMSDERMKKKEILLDLVRELDMNHNKPLPTPREIEEMKLALAAGDREIAVLRETIANLTARLEGNEEGRGMSVGETALTFYYLFDQLGVDFSNSDKTQWARFIHTLTGKSYQRVRNALIIDFDRKTTRKYLRNVASLFAELFPSIEEKIKNDMEPIL